MKFVAVTSCPTGIAHTYMAAENLEQTGKDQGHDVQVETQGSAGTIPLSDEVIAAADGVIFAADLEVKGKERFAGKPFVDVGVKAAVHKPLDVMAAAVAAVENAPKAGTPAAAAAAAAGPKASSGPATRNVGVGTRVRQWLMTGVSYMIPFVAAGGILIALGFLFGGEGVVYKLYGSRTYRRTWEGVPTSISPATCRRLHQRRELRHPAGSTPASPGCCSSSARSPSSCWCRSCPASSPSRSLTDPVWCPASSAACSAGLLGAGFLGGLVSGFAAGGIAYFLTRLKVPKGVRGVMPVVVIPLVSTIVVGLFMIFVVGKPIAAATTWLTEWLTGLSGVHGHRARHHPGPDDGLRPGWSGQQGGLHIRRRRSDDGHRHWYERPLPSPADHGRGDGGRHDPAARHGACHRWSARSCGPRPSGRMVWLAGCSAPRSSPRVRSRSLLPTRCGSSRRPWPALRSPAPW